MTIEITESVETEADMVNLLQYIHDLVEQGNTYVFYPYWKLIKQDGDPNVRNH